jgi:serine/threonine protein kinase
VKICPQCSELYPDDAGFCPLDGTKLVPSTDPLLGRTISSRYRLTKKLGTGGMAVVYLARHVMIDRLNAIKILRRDLSLDPNQRERFLREARAVNRINHPNIVEITDFGEFEGTAYLVMEYAPAESLLQALKRGPFAWDRVVRIAEQISSALARAHEAGVIHRDIKPANIFLARRDAGEIVVKVLDFGIARMKEVAAPENRALTTTGLLLGSPLYMSPEQVLRPKDVDPRTDLWSLGVVLYEALTGKTPYGDTLETVGALFVSICSKPAPSVRETVPSIREGVAAIVKRALAIDVAARYASAEEFAADIKKELGAGFALDETMLASVDSSRAEVDPLAATAVQLK